MELSKQIRSYRNKKALSQDQLAEQVFVSRQTISNWETGKSYPDVNSLILLSQVFEVSLDQLIKGDAEKMKVQIQKEDQKNFSRLSIMFTILLLATVLTPIPLVHFLSSIGIAIWLVILGIAAYTALLVEREKKKFDMQTYKEILAFMEGKSLDEIERARETGKRPYQTIMMALAVGGITLILSLLMLWVLKIFPQ